MISGEMQPRAGFFQSLTGLLMAADLQADNWINGPLRMKKSHLPLPQGRDFGR